jgi:hypothetical protein
MPLLDYSDRFVSDLDRILKLLRLYQRGCVKDISATTCYEMRRWIIFIRLVRYLFARDNCARCVMLADKISAFTV